jgi:hypothetical protein
MSSALNLIVSNYVSLKNRKAIEELREHRHELRRRLAGKASGWFDTGHLIGLIDDDLKAIEAGLDRL